MGTISLTLPVTGTVITAGLHSTNYTTLQNAINGGLDNSNINASAAITQSKLAFDSWQNFTPVLTGSTSNPTLGSGSTQYGRYVQIGKTVLYTFRCVMGSSGFVNGSGNVEVSLPVAMAAAMQSGGPDLGASSYIDISAGFTYGLVATPHGSSTSKVTFRPATGAIGSFLLTYTTPATWATTDEISGSIVYEAA